MDRFESRFATKLREQIEKEVADKLAKLVSPKATDYAAYCERVGEIRGLERAAAISKEIESQMGQTDTKAAPGARSHQAYEA